MSQRSFCKKHPKLCRWIGVFGSTAHDRRDRKKWRWLRWWAEILIDENRLPTYQELAALAGAFLSAGGQARVEIAQEITAVLLDKGGVYAGGLDRDVLTKANVQLIAARSSALLDDMGQAERLLQEMPERGDLIKAIKEPTALG